MKSRKLAVVLTTVTILLGVSVASANPNMTPQVAPSPNTTTPSAPTQSQPPSTRTETIVEEEPIPFAVSTIENSRVAKGSRTVQTDGVAGNTEITYNTTYRGSIQVSKVEVGRKTTTQPVNEVDVIGTYVAPSCSNGSYVNVYGNAICNPSSNSDGATALCRDGSYSYSQSRSGTCSHHGGVSEWL